MILDHPEGGRVKTAFVNVNTADGTNVVVRPVADKYIVVLSYDIQIQAAGPLTAYFVNDDGSTKISRKWKLVNDGDAVVREAALCRRLFTTGQGKGLNIRLSAGIETEVSVTYLELP